MAIPKKERFNKVRLNYPIQGIPAFPFPPEKISYNGLKLQCLGRSNKEDLFPTSIDDPVIARASMTGRIGQFIYVAPNSDLYDALLYIDETDTVILYGLRTTLQ